jgi:hypothetical protein
VKRSLAIIILIVLLAGMLAPAALAKAATPTPTPKPTLAEDLPFSGGSNSISGAIYDASGNEVGGAKVTLYYTAWVGTEYKARDPVGTSTNPQYSGDGISSTKGMYTYTGIPSGVYVLTAEKGGISVSEVIMVTGGTTTKNLFIQGYIDSKQSPTPIPTEGPTYRPPPTATAVPVNNTGDVVVEIVKILLMGIVALQFIVGVVIVAFQTGKGK